MLPLYSVKVLFAFFKRPDESQTGNLKLYIDLRTKLVTIPAVGGGGMRLPQKEVFFISFKIALQYCMRPLDGQGGMVKKLKWILRNTTTIGTYTSRHFGCRLLLQHYFERPANIYNSILN